MEVREPSAKYLVRPAYKQTEAGVIPADWDIHSLGEIGKFKNGLNKDSAAFGHGSPFVNLMDVFGVNAISTAETLGLVACSSVERSSYDLRLGDVIFVRSSVKPSGVGLTAVIEADLPDTVFSGFLIRFRDSGFIDAGFKKHCFHGGRFRNSLIASSSVSANTNISQNNLAKLAIPLPPTKAEQEAIAEALSDADALIESLEQLLAKKRDVKQGAMQELLTGKKRLPGFSGVWRNCCLGDLGTCFRGVGYDPDTDLSEGDTNASVRLLRSNNVQGALIVFADMQYVDERRVSAAQLLRIEDVLICTANGSRDLVGKAARFTSIDGHRYTFGAFMGCFRPNVESADPLFTFYLFQSHQYRSQICVLLAGSSINNLSPGAVEGLVVRLPGDRAEQTAIATILSDMDTELAAIDAKLTKARQIKQAMMQALLTGRIRLV